MSSSREIAAKGFSALVAPEHGALLVSLRWRGPSGREHALLHSPEGAVPDTAAPNRFGLWPMLPFANRAFGGIVDDGMQRFRLPLNDLAMESTIHGFGWQSPWQVEASEPDSLTLSHSRRGENDPYAYDALMTLSCLDHAVRVALSVTSRADRPLPYGLGFHPWLPLRRDTAIEVAAGGRLALGERYRAAGAERWLDGGPFAGGAPVPPEEELAISFLDWRGPARFVTPSLGLALAVTASETLRHPVLWTPPGADFICFEPQSHGIGAPSEAAARAVTPLARLEPGETLAGWMELSPSEI